MMGKKKKMTWIWVLVILGALLILGNNFQMFAAFSYPSGAIKYDYFKANNCKIAQPYKLSIVCEAPGPPSQEFLMAAGPGNLLGVEFHNDYKVEGFSSSIYNFWCDQNGGTWGNLIVKESSGVQYCTSSLSDYGSYSGNCKGKTLLHGQTYTFSIRVYNKLLSSGNCYVSVYGNTGYLYAFGPDGTYRKMLPQTQNCQSQDILQDLKQQYTTVKADQSTPYRVTGRTPEQGSIELPYYYMEVAPVQPDINPDGYMVQCDQPSKILKGYTQMSSLDGNCWVSPTASVEIIQGYDSTKSNYVQYFSCGSSYCDLTIYSGWANYQCLPRIPTDKDCRDAANACLTGYECKTDPSGKYYCQFIPVSPVGKCCNIPEDCFSPYEITRSDGQDISVTPICDKANLGSCPSGTGQCSKNEKLVACRFDVTYPNSKCCFHDTTGNRYLDNCHGTITDCRTLGTNACCLGTVDYTPLAASPGQVCCDASGNTITSGIGTSITQADCNKRKQGSIVFPDLLSWIKNMFGLDKLFGAMADTMAWVLLAIIVILALWILSKLFGGRRGYGGGTGGGGGQVIIVR